MSAADKATEVVADVAEEVSDQAQMVAETSRGLSGRNLSLALGGFAVGAVVGGAAAYFVTRRRLETKYSQIADDEVAEMRDHYQAKVTALEAQNQKDDLQSIVEERGYSSPSNSDAPPMAVQPPDSVATSEPSSETAEEEVESSDEPSPPSETRNVFEEAKVNDVWDYQEELKRRSPDIPYVIHYDERHEMEGYDEVTLTYYEVDDVLCNERDEIVDPDQRNFMVGERNLNLFGHGSNDASIVYVRNDKLEIVFELVRSPNSFAEEVHGFQHDAYSRGNLERMRARERDDPEE